MIHSNSLNRGILDKSYPTRKIAVSLKSGYSTILSTCISKLWDDCMRDDCSFSFYLADGSGAQIESSLTFVTQSLDDTPQELEWTLENYLKISAKYPSKLCLYCVMRMGQKDKSKKWCMLLHTFHMLICGLTIKLYSLNQHACIILTRVFCIAQPAVGSQSSQDLREFSCIGKKG